MRDDSFRDQLPRALSIVWLIIGFVSGFAVISPFLVAPESLFGIFPVCAAKAAGGQCLLCGMTTAFVQIGAGHLRRCSPGKWWIALLCIRRSL